MAASLLADVLCFAVDRARAIGREGDKGASDASDASDVSVASVASDASVVREGLSRVLPLGGCGGGGGGVGGGGGGVPLPVVSATAQADLDYGDSVAAVTAFARTSLGARALGDMMRAPTHDAAALAGRRAGLEDMRLVLQPGSAGELEFSAALERARAAEAGALWCCTPPEAMDADSREALAEPYFGGLLDPVHGAWPALWASTVYVGFVAPVLAACVPLAYVLTPYMVIRFRMKLRIGFGTYLRLMYHTFQSASHAVNFAMGGATSVLVQLASLLCTALVYVQAVGSALRASRRVLSAGRRINAAYRSACEFCEAGAELQRAAGPAARSVWAHWAPPGMLGAQMLGPCGSALPSPSQGA
jgi:hypothetical protein